jgi:hypothetical protein
MIYTLRQNITRWPKVFTVLVLLTVLDLVTDFGLCRYVGNQSVRESLWLVSVVTVEVAIVAGVTYKLLVSAHGFTIAALLDRVEGRPVTVETEENDLDDEEETFEDEIYEEEEEDEETSNS